MNHKIFGTELGTKSTSVVTFKVLQCCCGKGGKIFSWRDFLGLVFFWQVLHNVAHSYANSFKNDSSSKHNSFYEEYVWLLLNYAGLGLCPDKCKVTFARDPFLLPRLPH